MPQQLSRHVGSYRDKDLTLRIAERDGHLWMGINDEPPTSYLMPLASGQFANRTNSGTLLFVDEKDGHFAAVLWTYGSNSGRRFERVSP